MKLSEKVLSTVLILFIIAPLFAGCLRGNPKSRFVYTVFYSGPETIYPVNMPAASEFTKKGMSSDISRGSEGSTIKEPFSLDELKEIHYVDSWYRVTVNKMLTESEASHIGGRSSLSSSHVFFECTAWYDYIREEKLNRTILLSQGFSPGDSEGTVPSFEIGQSYIMFLIYPIESVLPPHELREFTGTLRGSNLFYLFTVDGREYAFRGNKFTSEFDSYTLKGVSVEDAFYEAAFDVGVLGDLLRGEFTDTTERNEYFQQHKTGSHQYYDFEVYIDQQAAVEYKLFKEFNNNTDDEG